MDYKISVIVSTYNWPAALAAALSALISQEDGNFEIIIADDGSTHETKEVVNRYRKLTQIKIQHVWQEDKGFRAAEIRNKAAQIAEGSYLLFLDGDCIPTLDWIHLNRCLAEPRWMVQGQRILLNEEFSQIILAEASSHPFSPTLKQAIHLSSQNKINRWWPLLHLPLGIIRKVKPKSWKKIRTCNLGVWKSDFMKIQGFDESFVGWGHEDADLAVRLINSGVRTKTGAFSSAVFHLWHRLASRTNAYRNLAVVLERVHDGTIFPNKGICIK